MGPAKVLWIYVLFAVACVDGANVTQDERGAYTRRLALDRISKVFLPKSTSPKLKRGRVRSRARRTTLSNKSVVF